MVFNLALCILFPIIQTLAASRPSSRVFWSEQLQICHNDPGDAAFPLSQVPLSDSAEAAAADGFTPSAGKEQISSGGSEAELTSRQRQSRQKETQSPQFHLIVL